MALLIKNNAMFLHIPKTGGLWVRQVLKELDLAVKEVGPLHSDIDRTINNDLFASGRHVLAIKLRQKLSRLSGTAQKEKPYMFCFVRHPLTWYQSMWKFCMFVDWYIEDEGDWSPFGWLSVIKDTDFNSFVRKLIKKCPGYVTEFYSKYTGPGIDFVGKQEDLENGLVQILKTVGLDFDEKKILCAQRGNVATADRGVPESAAEWDPELKELVLRLEYPALVKYGYEPRPPELSAYLDPIRKAFRMGSR